MTRRAKPWASAAIGKTCSRPRCRRPAPTLDQTLPERQDHESRICKASPAAPPDTIADPSPVPRPVPVAAPHRRPWLPAPAADKPPAPPPAGKGARVGAIVVLLLIVLSLTWYFVSDRLTPYTSQARVQAFVVPVAAEVAGKVLKVHVKNNDEVQPGQPLFDIDPTPYRIALQRSRSDYESVRRSVNGSDAIGGGGQGGAAGGRGHQGLRAAGCDAAGTDLRRRSRRDLAPPRPERAGHPAHGAAASRRPPRRICATPRRPRVSAATTTRN